MHPLIVLTAAATCVFARPPSNGGTPLPTAPQPLPGPMQERYQPQTLREAISQYMMPQYILPSYRNIITREEFRPPPPRTQYDWLSREIERLNLMEAVEDDFPIGYEKPKKRDDVASLYDPIIDLMIPEDTLYIQRPLSPKREMETMDEEPEEEPEIQVNDKNDFAYTPFEKEFFEPGLEELEMAPARDLEDIPQDTAAAAKPPLFMRQREMKVASMTLHEPRQIRQNPNLSKAKTLVAENLDKLRTGVAGKDYRVPVSLLPTNLRWLKISHSDDHHDDDSDDKSSHENDVNSHHHVHMVGGGGGIHLDATDPIFGVAVIAAVGAATTVAIAGLAFGWYTLSKKAKAAADVDYPAYGVTGPTNDTSGDRKLAHSAHMYHYQHQKQQILAMEKNGLDRKGSLSDPESEEENEEGDYTVYECPGFATTGDMEVKNPMFNDDPTPTPGKAEVVKPQPKE